jgi:uncharacterized protein
MLSPYGDREHMFCYPHRRIEEYMPHQNHPAIIKRLKRSDGHLQTIIEMIENDRPCLLIAQQLQKVESAIESAKKALIHDHISNCFERPLRTAGSSGRALKEFKLIAKYL